MQVKVLDPFKSDAWSQFVATNRDSMIFHHVSWMWVLKAQYKFKTFVIVVMDDDKILAGIPVCETKSILRSKKWVSLPFSDLCPPLYDSEESLHILMKGMVELSEEKKINSIEVRWGVDSNTGFSKSLKNIIHYTKIDVNEDVLFDSFKVTQVQQPIRKAKKEGLSVEITSDPQRINDFYELHLMTRKKLGVPIQPKSYFKHVSKLFNENLGFIVLVRNNDLVVSAGVFLGFGKILSYKYGASHPDYLRLRPNNLMIWEAMLEGGRLGYKLFDFGKTELQNKGLAKFKSGWGSYTEELPYSYIPENEHKTMFDTVNSKIVVPVIQNSPKIVCRFIGELLYKFMA